jgi:hypothetical protein
MIEVVQHVPSFVDIGEPRRRARIETAADLERIEWIHAWRKTPPHTFDCFAQVRRQARTTGLLLAVFDAGSYWWVVAYLSDDVPGLEEWSGPRYATT